MGGEVFGSIEEVCNEQQEVTSALEPHDRVSRSLARRRNHRDATGNFGFSAVNRAQLLSERLYGDGWHTVDPQPKRLIVEWAGNKPVWPLLPEVDLHAHDAVLCQRERKATAVCGAVDMTEVSVGQDYGFYGRFLSVTTPRSGGPMSATTIAQGQ